MQTTRSSRTLQQARTMQPVRTMQQARSIRTRTGIQELSRQVSIKNNVYVPGPRIFVQAYKKHIDQLIIILDNIKESLNQKTVNTELIKNINELNQLGNIELGYYYKPSRITAGGLIKRLREKVSKWKTNIANVFKKKSPKDNTRLINTICDNIDLLTNKDMNPSSMGKLRILSIPIVHSNGTIKYNINLYDEEDNIQNNNMVTIQQNILFVKVTNSIIANIVHNLNKLFASRTSDDIKLLDNTFSGIHKIEIIHNFYKNGALFKSSSDTKMRDAELYKELEQYEQSIHSSGGRLNKKNNNNIKKPRKSVISKPNTKVTQT